MFIVDAFHFSFSLHAANGTLCVSRTHRSDECLKMLNNVKTKILRVAVWQIGTSAVMEWNG